MWAFTTIDFLTLLLCFMVLFSFVSRFFLLFLVISSLIYWLFKGVVFNCYLRVNFPVFLLLSISSFISSWLGKILSVISDFLNVLRLVLWPNVYPSWRYVPCALGKGIWISEFIFFFFFNHFAQRLGTTSQPYYIHWRFVLVLPHRPRCIGRNAQGTYRGQDYLWVVLGAPQMLPSRVRVGAEMEVLCCVLMTARHASATTIREVWKKLLLINPGGYTAHPRAAQQGPR